MHIIKTKEKIEVLVIFRKNQAQPYCFKWAGKRFVIDKINLVYSQNKGDGQLVYFSVSSQDNYFKLVFETNTLAWWLEEAYSE